MNKVKELLKFEGLAATDEQIIEVASRRNINLDEIDDDKAAEIVSSIKSSVSTLAVNNGGATPASSKAKGTGRGRKSAKQVSLKDAIVKAAKDTETELTTMETVIRQQKGKYIEQRSDALVNEIRNTSTEIVEAVTDRLMEETPDAETFQQIGTELGEGLFPLSA